MKSKYVILSIEEAKYKFKKAILVMANEVEFDTSSYIAKMFGKTYYTYSRTETKDTLYLVYPFSEQLMRSLINQARRCENEDFMTINMKEFSVEDMFYNGKPVLARIHNDILESQPRVSPFTKNMFYDDDDDDVYDDDDDVYDDDDDVYDDDDDVIYDDDDIIYEDDDDDDVYYDEEFINQNLIKDEELDNASGHPARPDNIPITKENQRTYYKAYYRCPDYLSKMNIYINDEYIGNNPFTSKAALCKQDCLFPTCPFYDFWSVNHRFNPYNNHTNDYDEWVVEGYKARFKN